MSSSLAQNEPTYRMSVDIQGRTGRETDSDDRGGRIDGGSSHTENQASGGSVGAREGGADDRSRGPYAREGRYVCGQAYAIGGGCAAEREDQ